MEPALDVTGRALSGDPGACSFLDRTSSIYVLDATDSSKPKTYGCWNFIHQAMNEIERYEARFFSENQCHALTNGAGLTNHVKLLSTMALRVARRSPNVDRKLVETCVVNAGQYQASANQSQWLVDLNLELREIVMGRIAAMVFDFSFHKSTGAHGHSAFADPTVMEVFCAVLAANAVSSGPIAISHFITEWIVPSAKSLPPYAVACVAMHLPLEALRKSAPCGTKDKLQQLSASVMSIVVGPVLADAISESSTNASGETGSHNRNNLIVAICLRSIERWCAATELSLAQIKHICSKIGINIVDILSDAMYSDYGGAIDALADLVESATKKDTTPYVLEERMNQVRYIMQVDEASFKSSFSADQLISIETKEMESIIDELVSAIGLQRFRFVERQNNGDHDVCRSLARIAASVCMATIRAAYQGQPLKTESGLVDLIMKAAAHPSVNICGIGLEVLTELVKVENGLAMPLLPILQRRAITPHHMVSGVPSLAASDICGVNFHEFQNFRENVLSGALIACYQGSADNYMDSCTSAVEEFCASTATINVSLHLEAALFCLGTVADEALSSHRPFAHSSQLDRCTKSLAGKPASLTENPLTLAQMCRFLREYTRWYGEGQANNTILEVATELAMSTFNLSASVFPDNTICSGMINETSVSPFKEAALTLRELLCHSPQQFVSISAIAALGAGWEASYAASNRINTVTIEDRVALCVGICHVLAALPANQRIRSFHALALPSLDCFEKMVKMADEAITAKQSKEKIESILSRIAHEIQILKTMSRTFTNACSVNDVSMESGCRTSADRHRAISQPLLVIIKKVWPAIKHVASTYSGDEKVAVSLGAFLIEFMPPDCENNDGFALMKELFSIVFAMMESINGGTAQFRPIFDFLVAVINVHGEALERSVHSASVTGKSMAGNKEELGMQVKTLLMSGIDAVKSSMSAKLAIPKEQGQGQRPFESKCDQEPKGELNSNEAFAGIFSLFTMCLERCPVFFLKLPATREVAQDADGLLYNRAVDSAVASLVEADVQTSKAAMEFLDSVVKLSNSHNEEVRRIVSEALGRIRGNLLTMLLLGCCGKVNDSALGDLSLLLHAVLRSCVSSPEQNRLALVSALNHEYFRLGKHAGSAILSMLERASRSEITSNDLTAFLEEIWELHQVDDTHVLENTDIVERFAVQYGQ